MFHIKNKKQPKAKKVIFVLSVLKYHYKGNRDEKYTALCRKDNSSVKRHKDSWHKGSNSLTCTIIPSSEP